MAGQSELERRSVSDGAGLSASAIKYIAIAAMFIDHAANAFGVEYYGPLGVALHFVGRITGPVMFFYMSVGYHASRNVNRYTLRLAAFAVLSYLPFIYYKSGSLWPTAENWMSFNVIYTLLMGHLALRAVYEVKNLVLSWAAVFVCMVLASYGDWGFFAVAAILLFDMLRGNFKNQCLGFGLLTLVVKVLPPLTSALRAAGGPQDAAVAGFLAQAFVACGMFVPLGLLALYNGERGKSSKWVFYIFYPAHLLLLGIAKKAFLLAG